MSISAQETTLYVYNEDDSKVVSVCATSISGSGNSRDDIETTTLCDDARQYMAGLKDVGEVTFDINWDPKEDAHEFLNSLFQSGDTADWAIGMSDGDEDPTWASGWDFTDRSNIQFKAYVNGFSWDFAQNVAVSASLTLRPTGDAIVEAKTT